MRSEADDDILRERALKQAIAARRRAKRMTAMKPTPGIWYYLYLKPTWKMRVLCGNYGHVELWPELVNDVVQHYGLSQRDAEKLVEAPYGFPRGRCSLTADKVWKLQHGDDFPSSLSQESEKRKLIGEFGLTTLFLNDKQRVVFEYDEHEVMGDYDKDIVQSVIGKVPY